MGLTLGGSSLISAETGEDQCEDEKQFSLARAVPRAFGGHKKLISCGSPSRTMKTPYLIVLVVTLTSIARAETPPQFLLKWGSQGSGNGQFERPQGIAVRDAKVYVVDGGNSRVQLFSTDGIYIAQWGSQGSSDGQFNGPAGIAIAQDDNIYVVDNGNHRIQKFTPAGVFLLGWHAGTVGFGSSPVDIGLDRDGNAYVTVPHFVMSSMSNQVQKFTSRLLKNG